ncbi:hypothetical protein R3P38DRAFT_2800927 [Favolaschia claudopus]|uniref:Uncharacterized protein n=1 Tax=Favolaschia claudopus TaxID=2862362 RepID=A0AAV9ZX43_9AGAR
MNTGERDSSLSLTVPAKRGPGRPKGSRNKKQRVESQELEPPEPKPRGRPRGSGPKQKARAQGITEPDLAKRPVGRPPKMPPPAPLSIRLGNETRTVRGMPAVIRSKNVSQNVNSTPLHSIFTPSSSSTPPAVTSTTKSSSTSHHVTPSVLSSTAGSSTIPVVEEDEENEEGDYTGLLEDAYGLGEDDDDDEDEGDDPDPSSLPEDGSISAC